MIIKGTWPLDDDHPAFLTELEVEMQGDDALIHVINRNGFSYACATVPVADLKLLIRSHEESRIP